MGSTITAIEPTDPDALKDLFKASINKTSPSPSLPNLISLANRPINVTGRFV